MAAEAAKAAPIRVTVDGVEVEVARETLADDLDTLELLSDVDGGNVLAMPRLLLAVANSLREEPIDPFARPDRMAMGADELAEYLSRPRVAVSETEAHAHGRQAG